MPQQHRAHRPTGGLKAHHRTSSGGSSKIGLNLHLTQKDSNLVKHQEKLKRNGQSAVELLPSRTTSPLPRAPNPNLGNRVQLQSQHPAQKRPQSALSSKRPAPAQKPAFTLASSAKTDDDEWVSSESGAATPIDDSDEDSGGVGTPIERRRVGPNDHVAGTTPRAEPVLTRVETARPVFQLQPPASRVQTTPSLAPPASIPVRETRSAAPSPPRILHHPAKRFSLTRQLSASSDMPPHPLIRGQSYHGVMKPSPLAPLTVNSETAQAQISSSPPSARDGRSSISPIHMIHPTSLQSPTRSADSSRQPVRRTSVSSAHSVATLPVPSSSTKAVGSRTPQGDRTRTLSTISLSSSSAALSSLNALPAMSRPGTPPLTSHFPPDNFNSSSDGHHSLLPPPYLAAHITLLNYYNPSRECYNRVMRARPRR